MAQNRGYRELDVALLGQAMISDEAVAVLRRLCERCGSRFAGSRDEWRAGQFLADRMAEIGLANVRLEDFPFLAWQRGRRAKLRTTSPRRRSFDAIALPYSPATRRGGVGLELLDLGEGMPEDFARAGRKVKGRAVMLTSASPGYYPRWVHRAEKYALAVKHGARAFLFVNHSDGLLPPTGSLRFNRRAEIPGLGLARETAAQIQRLASEGPVTLHLETFDRTLEATGRNVVGELVGAERPDELVVVGGHYDGHDISQAADDNGSGVATVLEAARLLAPHASALERTVRFVCFSAEEVGLIGAQAYVDRHEADLTKHRLMVNVDCIGHSRGKGYDFHGWDQAKPLLAKMAADMHLGIPFASRPNAYSDHFPFLVHGVPNCGLGSIGGAPAGRGYGHTAADTLDKVSRADLREAAALLARSLLRFANEAHWALGHKSRTEVLAMLERFDVIESLRTEGTLPDALK